TPDVGEFDDDMPFYRIRRDGDNDQGIRDSQNPVQLSDEPLPLTARHYRPMPRVYIRTFGCQMNEYDSAKMVDVLRDVAGYELTQDPSEADLLLLNTCSVREKAQEKVFSQLGGWKQLKKAKPHVLIGVGGCVASQEGDGITRRAPYVDLVFGPQTLHRLPAMIDEDKRNGRSIVDISFREIEKFDALPAPRAEGATAFVSIM